MIILEVDRYFFNCNMLIQKTYEEVIDIKCSFGVSTRYLSNFYNPQS